VNARGQGSRQDALLATKLYVPRMQPGFVDRPRLTARLDEGLARRLILVSAPAGFGKTALLAAWASSAKRPVAWLSLDDGDNDPARFWRHVAAALEPACPGIIGRVGPLLGQPAPQSFEGVVTAGRCLGYVSGQLAVESQRRQARSSSSAGRPSMLTVFFSAR
jgi:LuxR family transcriptional regulator, maltose regulon positive regulatory protein